jgi:hypothetical protein
LSGIRHRPLAIGFPNFQIIFYHQLFFFVTPPGKISRRQVAQFQSFGHTAAHVTGSFDVIVQQQDNTIFGGNQVG